MLHVVDPNRLRLDFVQGVYLDRGQHYRHLEIAVLLSVWLLFILSVLVVAAKISYYSTLQTPLIGHSR